MHRDKDSARPGAITNPELWRDALADDRQLKRMTNVLSNGDVYRRIAELWQAWQDHIRSLSVSFRNPAQLPALKM